MLDHEGDTVPHDPFQGQPLPLNSKKLIIALLKQLAESIYLSTMGATDKIRQLVEGKLTGEGHDPKNVKGISPGGGSRNTDWTT